MEGELFRNLVERCDRWPSAGKLPMKVNGIAHKLIWWQKVLRVSHRWCALLQIVDRADYARQTTAFSLVFDCDAQKGIILLLFHYDGSGDVWHRRQLQERHITFYIVRNKDSPRTKKRPRSGKFIAHVPVRVLAIVDEKIDRA